MMKKCMLPLLLPVLLSGCAVIGSGLPSSTSLETRYSGQYEGEVTTLFGTAPHRLLLNVFEAHDKADGVLTNLNNGKSYTFSGQFVPVGDGGSVTAKLFESGQRHAANLTAQLTQQEGQTVINGQVRGVVLWWEVGNFDLRLRKVASVPPAAGPSVSTGLASVR